MSEYQTLVYKSADRVAFIGLNRPEVMNAINSDMCFELRRAIDCATADTNIRVIILYGEGRCFSAGGDLKAKESAPVDQILDQVYKPSLLSVFESTKPVIGAVHGPVIGIASALALSCDLLVMADDAYLSEPFVGLGLIPDGGVSWHLVRQCGRKRAYEIIVDGKTLSAVECADLGIANRITAADQLMPEVQSWAEELAVKPPLAMRYAKQALNAAMTMGLPESMSLEAKLQKMVADSGEAKEGLEAFLEKRSPDYGNQ
ncbi:MAG: enoyl-CoA hydratase/isomerase family protein [Gammaproteobacteria bacterium]|nr:enoyl-CoA hydratase/isomerase family protein [Gammaproteobacteria bacterium]